MNEHKKGQRNPIMSATGLTGSFRNLLFGSLSAIQLSAKYSTLKAVCRQFQKTEHRHPEGYLHHRLVLPGISGLEAPELPDLLKEVWECEWFRYEPAGLHPFHPLCEFYHVFVHGESRHLVAGMEAWRNNSAVSSRNLYYGVLSVCEQLSGFVRVCEEREGGDTDSGNEPGERLRPYLAQLLKYEIGAVLLELWQRFESILGEASHSPESFYIYILNQAVPEPLPFYRTRYSVSEKIRGIDYRHKVIHQLTDLLAGLKNDPNTGNKDREAERKAGIQQIENAAMAYYLLKSTGAGEKERVVIPTDPVAAAGYISQWIGNIGQGIPFSAAHCLQKLSPIIEDCSEGNEASEAARYLYLLQQYAANPDHGSTNSNGEENMERFSIPELPGTHPVLQDLVSVDELRDRLQISLVTLNKYLKDSRIPVIRFSAKSRWLRSEDCRKFLEYFTIIEQANQMQGGGRTG